LQRFDPANEGTHRCSSYEGYEEELNWSNYPPKHVARQANYLCGRDTFFEITNESFFERLCEFFKTEYDKVKDEADAKKRKQKKH